MTRLPESKDVNRDKLTRGQFRALIYVFMYQRRYMQSPFWYEIAHDTDIRRSEIGTILSKLRRKGYIDFEQKPRSILITEKGFEFLLPWYQREGQEWNEPRRWEYIE